MAPKSPFDIELTAKQERVLESAIDLFAEKGFERSSTLEIAERAGVAEGTIFKRFSTKKDLLIAVGIYIAGKIGLPRQAREVTGILTQDHERAEDLLRALVRNRIAFASKNRRMLRVLVQELPFHPQLQKLAAETVGQVLLPAAVEVIGRFQASGQLRKDLPPLTITRMIAGQFLSYVLVRFLVPRGPEAEAAAAASEEKEVEQMIDFLMRGLRP